MRIQNKHELKNYLGNRRIAVIQKAQHRTHTRIQFVNNRLVDKLIIDWNNEYPSEVYNPYDQDTIEDEINRLNVLASKKDLQRILQHSVVTRNPQTELEAVKVINSVSDSLSKLEAERVIKNLNYVADVMETANVDIQKYEALIEKLPYHVSRKSVIEKCIVEDSDLPPSKRQRWLERNLERGESYNKKYTYKELNQLSKDLERYKAHRLDYETAIMENKQADREGYGRINETKTWIWSQLEKTRHSQMDGETVALTESFEVVNEVTGDIDYLRFPGDVENDHSNCSNICNCGCTYDINQS